MSGRTALAVSLAVLVALAAVGGPTQGTAQRANPTEVDSCTAITTPGTYVLTANVTNATSDTCIEISASDVVLDGNGHLVDGIRPPTRRVLSNGVAASDATNVTVTDVRVSDWDHGVAFDNVSEGTVRGVTATGTEFGAFVTGSRNVTVADSSATDNVRGVVLSDARGAEVVRTVVTDNALAGISVDGGDRVTVSGAIARRNGGLGPALFRSPAESAGIVLANVSDARVLNASATGNVAGISLVNVSSTVVRGCSATDNDAGVLLVDVRPVLRADPTGITDCTVTDNEVGVGIGRSPRVNVSDVTADENRRGFDVVASDGVLVTDAVVARSEVAGFVVEDTFGGNFRNVTVTGTAGGESAAGVSAGVLLESAANNRFVGVTARDNENWSVYATGGPNFFAGATVEGTQLSFTATNVALDFGSKIDDTDEPSFGAVPLEVLATGPTPEFSLSLRFPGNVSNATTSTPMAESRS